MTLTLKQKNIFQLQHTEKDPVMKLRTLLRDWLLTLVYKDHRKIKFSHPTNFLTGHQKYSNMNLILNFQLRKSIKRECSEYLSNPPTPQVIRVMCTQGESVLNNISGPKMTDQ